MSKKILTIFGAILLLLLSILPLQSTHSFFATENVYYTNWSLARVDSNNSGFSTAAFPETLVFDSYLSTYNFHAPIVANNCYFLIDLETGNLHCYDIDSQALLWEKKYSNPTGEIYMQVGNVCAFSEASNQLLLLETVQGRWSSKKDFATRIYALHPKNGSILWQQDIEGYYSNSITLSDTEVYVKVIDITKTNDKPYISNKHKIACFHLQTGDMKWITKEIEGGEGYLFTNPPAVHEKYLVTTSTNCVDQIHERIYITPPCYINLIDRNTGSLVYSEIIEQFASPSTPLLEGDRVFFMVNSEYRDKSPSPINMYLFEFEIQDKVLIDKTHTRLTMLTQYVYMPINLAKYNGQLYFLDSSGLFSCISMDTHKIKWRKKVASENIWNPYFCNEDYVIVCTREGGDLILRYLNPEDGAQLYSTSSPFSWGYTLEISGTENHIWVTCHEKTDLRIAHFTLPPPPSITVTPLEIQDTCWLGTTDSFHHTLSVTTQGHIEGTIQCGSSWIRLNTHRVHEHLTSVQVEVQPAEQSVGVHQSTIVFDTNAGQIDVHVRLIVLLPPQLNIIPNEVTSTIVEGSSPPPTLFHVENTGGPGLEGFLSCQESWIQLSEHVIDDNVMSFTASYHTESLSPGIYKGTIVATSNGGNQTIPIVLTVIPKPYLVVTPMFIRKQVAIGSSESDTLFLSNTGGPGLSGTITSSDPWLLPSVNRYHDETKQVQVYLNAQTLQAGIYHGTLTFTGNDQVIVVPVTLECIVWITFRIGSTTVEVNKVKETIEAAPYLFQKRSYVPVRKLVESLPVVNYLKNTEIVWNPEEQKVTLLVGEELTIELWVDRPMARVNGKETPIDPDNLNITPQIRSGRTFLPLRFISETLGYTVEWIGSTQTIHVKYIVQGE